MTRYSGQRVEKNKKGKAVIKEKQWADEWEASGKKVINPHTGLWFLKFLRAIVLF